MDAEENNVLTILMILSSLMMTKGKQMKAKFKCVGCKHEWEERQFVVIHNKHMYSGVFGHFISI
jgi:hypothetical protein